jgi:LysR family transcriptional regulator, transcriptional activator of nhaA
MVKVLHDRIGPSQPVLQIGAQESIPKQILLRLIRAAFRISPCQVKLVVGRYEELLRDLSAFRIDIVVTSFIPLAADTSGLFHRQITKKNTAIYGAPKFRSLRKGFPGSIEGHPMILPTHESKLRYEIDHWANVHDLELNVVTESQDIAVKKLMAVSELGLIAAATHTVTSQVLSGELVEIGTLQGVHEKLFLVTAKRKIVNRIAAGLMRSFSV